MLPRLPFGVAATAGIALLLTACAPQEPEHMEAEMPSLEHVHAIVTDPVTGRTLLGTHDGLVAVNDDGTISDRVGGHGFDAMGLAAEGEALIASGHPGSATPADWGSPHLGIIRSEDGGRSWAPIAYAGEKDFHALAAGPSGELYGLSTDDPALLASIDGGVTWTPTGAALAASALAVDAAGVVYATTPDGVRVSSDAGATFEDFPGAPPLYLVNTSPDHTELAGVDVSGGIWRAATGDPSWAQVGTVVGQAQAITITATGDIAIVDDSGYHVLPE